MALPAPRVPLKSSHSARTEYCPPLRHRVVESGVQLVTETPPACFRARCTP